MITETLNDISHTLELGGKDLQLEGGGSLVVKADRKPLLNPKSIIKIGTWHVRSMHITGKVQPIANEMKIYGIHILGIAEARWKEAGQTWLSSGESIIYSGHTGDNAAHSDGVAIMLSKEAQKTLLGWELVQGS